ncbi:MAG: hypothetical protein E6H00_03460 [Bacillati bacterium ANGP1]|uniref:Uncharacterized protein n=1 Tax=Candidatus Segetimicrobium genomatis TaxID=2569760 RepID=A0A537K7J9_9BACT|nr:MAG: hypothetical protein E6H00_03460 [Terrabacteria group bacterium ANGP1]
MFEPGIFAMQVFPHRSTRRPQRAGGFAMRVILPVLAIAAFTLPSVAGEAPPISPTEEHPTADKQVMVAMFDETDSKWKVSELTGPEPPVSLKKFGDQNIWIFYGVKPSTASKGTLNIKVSRVFKDQSPMDTDYSFQYETTELGSWIPFYIGTGGSYSSSLQQVTIVINDVGASGPGAEVKRVLVKTAE